MAIKQSIGKLSLGVPFKAVLVEQFKPKKIELQDITRDHIEVVASLPWHHRDPFDRLIIAQGIVENIPIVSADDVFHA